MRLEGLHADTKEDKIEGKSLPLKSTLASPNHLITREALQEGIET